MISICLNRCFVFPRNSEYLETLNDDKESSLQFCVCPQKNNDCICEKEWSIDLRKGKIANCPDHGIFERTNESKRDVDRGFYGKRSDDHHTTLPPIITDWKLGLC